MRRPFATSAAVLATALAAPAVAASAAASLDFDRTFVARAGASQLHFTADYLVGGKPHRLEVWRDRELRVRRRTDDAVETVLVRPAGSDEWSMTVLDLQRRIRTDVDRTNLYRIGHYTDWFAQSHALARPRGAYRLEAIGSFAPAGRPLEACSWYRLTQGDRASRVCWSASRGIPLLVVGADDAVVWRVTHLSAGPLATGTFTIADRDYVRNDANRDIAAD